MVLVDLLSFQYPQRVVVDGNTLPDREDRNIQRLSVPSAGRSGWQLLMVYGALIKRYLSVPSAGRSGWQRGARP